MEYQSIALTIDEGAAILQLNRPEMKNALNSQTRAELLHAMDVAVSEARVIVLTGSGDSFCAGQDLSDREEDGSFDLGRLLREEYVPLLRAIYDAPIPVIAAVNGAAAGAGANLALAADVVIATESAIFLQAFSRIGLIPDAGGTYWLPRQIGFPKAMGAMLFAEPISARQAESWGMIWEAVPDADFDAAWRKRMMQLAKGPTVAFGLTKKALRDCFDNTIEEQLALEATGQATCNKTRDFDEGVMAFLEKRKPVYEGR
ncbi:MAG: enoyl-CoA hydratase-related protein [Mangrovicoccus sp.]|nr:enoyl-CoA hydratase-related protein [Mangrovicoccus sp.]